MNNPVTILIHDPAWRGHAPKLRKAAQAALKAKQEVTLVLANDAEVKTLNHQYRGKNKPTNVLSFPDGTKVAGVVQLGDVVLALETIQREAKEQQKTFAAHLTHLVIHGLLHLQGYDHEQDAEAVKMEKREIKLLAAMGIANPYESD